MKLPRALRVASCVGIALVASWARGAEIADPARAGFDAGRLGRLDAVIQAQVDQKKIAGVVLYVARDGQEVRHRGYGMSDLEAGKAMKTEAIFRIASMSKAVTSVAVMMLYEEGKLLLHDPVAKYIPEFTNSVVAVAPPEGSPAGTKFTTVKAKRPIQIRDLLTHTAGLTYGTGPAAALYKEAKLDTWYFANKDATIGEEIKKLAALPLNGQPGEVYQYGYSTDVLGYLVEVVSGMPLDKFFAERIFGPLKMVDSCFYLAPEKAGRLAPVYGVEKGVLGRGDQGDYVTGPRKCFSGGAGLLATAGDYGRLLQMLLNEGELDGVRLLSPKAVQLMRANHTGTKYAGDTGAFGLGFWVMQDVGFYGELGSVGAYGWGSAYFPQYLVDPKEKIVALMMTQLRPTGGSDLNQKFKVMMYQALVK
jgi:CubicO group peptidase (beta-lactamase class C family)